MSALHNIWIEPEIGDYGNLTGPRFFSLCYRLTAYSGVMAARQQDRETPESDDYHGEPTKGSQVASGLAEKYGFKVKESSSKPSLPPTDAVDLSILARLDGIEV